jgi:flagella basal body P-ring formation protein FlgA
VGGVTVTATATALQDGAPGDAIFVRNDRGGKRLQCTVVSAGVVRVETAPAIVRGG